MSLVNYSDSDNSESMEENHVSKEIPSSKSSRATFQKVVDRSNTGKAKISLPDVFIKDNEENEPPTKKAKTGEETLSSFNSFLPAPTRSMSAASISTCETPTKKGVFNLKNGSTPGFSRNSVPVEESVAEQYAMLSSTMDVDSTSISRPQQNASSRTASDGKSLIYKPLSVSRRSENKKSTPISHSLPVTPKTNPGKPPKVSLFSLSVETNLTPNQPRENEYEPMIYDISEELDEESVGEKVQATYEDFTPTASFSSFPIPPPVPTPPISSDLLSVAEHLHLSASERRQLFGRNKREDLNSASNIINFNMDEEYSHNEELRATGEQVVHNPVRSIAPGKHSLKQLVNAAQSQKEALEESFAKGKSNRAEASSRYGW